MIAAQKLGPWQPPESVSREDTLARSQAVLAKPDLLLRETEDIFRIDTPSLARSLLGWLRWSSRLPSGFPSPGSEVRQEDGVFLLHGGSGDYKSMEPMAKLFAGKFGCKAVAMTFPGRLYLDDQAATGRATPSIPTAPSCAPGPAGSWHPIRRAAS